MYISKKKGNNFKDNQKYLVKIFNNLKKKEMKETPEKQS